MISAGNDYYSKLSIRCSGEDGEGLSKWVVEDDLDLKKTTCKFATTCSIEDIVLGIGASIFPYQDHLGLSFTLSDSIPIESTIRVSCIRPGSQ